MTELTSRQFIIIAVFIMLTSKLVTMPTVVFASASNDAIFSVIINSLIELLLIFIITFIIKRNPDTSLFDLLAKKFSKIGAYIIIAILAIFLIARLTFCYEELYSFFLQLLYDDFSPYIFAIPTFFVTGYLAYKGARSIGRTLEILFWFILIGTMIAVISNANLVTFHSNIPYFQNGITPILEGSYTSAFYFGNSLGLLFFVGKVRINDNLVKNTMITCSLIALLIAALCFIFYDVFGLSMEFTMFALTEYSQYNPFILELQRLVWLSAIVDITKLFCSTACLTYCLGQAGKVFTKSKTTLLPIITVFLLVFSLATILHYDLLSMIELVRNYLSLITLGIIALSLIICLILAINRRKNAEKFIQ